MRVPESGASYQVRSYRPGDEEQILALFNHVFRQSRGMAHWRWKFAGNPEGHQITLAVAGERVVGQFAGLPVRATGPGGPFVLSQGVDHMVDPEFQRRGVFAAMTHHFAATWLPPAHDAVFYSYPLAHKHSIDQRITRAELVHPVRALRFVVTRGAPAGAPRGWHAWRHRVVQVRRFAASVDHLWRRLVPAGGVSVVRDARYLNWRYADCPDESYALLQVESRLARRPLGLAVLRFGWFEEKIAPLVELIVPPEETAALALLLDACGALARDHGLESVLTWAPRGTALHPVLLGMGWGEEETPFLLTQIADDDTVRAAALRTAWTYAMGDSDVY